jgi:transposase
VDYQPGSGIRAKKKRRDWLIALVQDHPEMVLGYQDETWWSRVTQPRLNAWAEGGPPLRLVAQTVAKDDADPKALACYGLLVSCPAAQDTFPEQVWLRFVDGHPISEITNQYLAWCCGRLAKAEKKTLLMIWDNASWHVSRKVRDWIRTHNRQVKKQEQGVRLIAFFLPVKSPWLNAIEPHWVHGKRDVVEPAGLLSAQQLAERACAHFGCSHDPHLTVTEKVA